MALGAANAPPRRGRGVKAPDLAKRHPSQRVAHCMFGRLDRHSGQALQHRPSESQRDIRRRSAERGSSPVARSRCGGTRSKSTLASMPQEDRRSFSGPRAGSPCTARGDKAGEPVPTVSRRRGLALDRRQRCGREGGRTGVCAPGLRNRTGKVSERPGWPGADMAGRSVLRISDPGSHAVRVRAALTVCLCAGFLYAKGVPPRARPSAGWWLSAPIFRNTHNPDRRAPWRSVDGPPQE